MKFTWTKELPTQVGWYWKRESSSKYDDAPECVRVRDYAGRLAIGNCTLAAWPCEKYEWAGPIPLPNEPKNS